MQYIDKTKIETYTVSPQAPSTSIVYNPSGTYNINQQVLTETQVILRYDLLLISSFFYTKPFLTMIIGNGSLVKKFADDATMNNWINTNLTPLNFLAV